MKLALIIYRRIDSQGNILEEGSEDRELSREVKEALCRLVAKQLEVDRCVSKSKVAM